MGEPGPQARICGEHHDDGAADVEAGSEAILPCGFDIVVGATGGVDLTREWPDTGIHAGLKAHVAEHRFATIGCVKDMIERFLQAAFPVGQERSLRC